RRIDINGQAASEADIESSLNKYYAERGGVMNPQLKEVVEELTREHVEIEAAAAADGAVVEADAPLIKLVNSMIVDAFKMRASDIHLEPMPKRFRVRYRIDGVLHEMKAPPKRLQPAIISRLKIMSNLDIAERRMPQDGRIKLRYNTREIDFRVATLPTTAGEKPALLILDTDALTLDRPP